MTIKHSFLPPSGASAWSKCALWPTMNARFPESNTAESEEGTAAHWVMAELLAGREIAEDTLAPNGVVVTGEMIEGAQLVAETADRICPESRLYLITETPVYIHIIHPDCFGTPDICVYDPNTLHLDIIDYKFGHRFVDEWFNLQGLMYMAGFIGQLSELPETVSFTIVQPRCFYRGEPVRTHTYRLSEATPYLSRVREAAERAYQPQPTATTGAHCEHCPGRHACPTLQKAAYSDAETSTDQQPVELTPAAAALELRMLERALLRLTSRVEGLRELTTANLRNGVHVPHFKLEATRSTTKWTVPPAQVIKKLGKKASVPKVITPTQARKLYLDEEIISGIVDIIPGGLRLAESNNSDAARVFKSKETYEQPREHSNPSRPPGHGEPV